MIGKLKNDRENLINSLCDNIAALERIAFEQQAEIERLKNIGDNKTEDSIKLMQSVVKRIEEKLKNKFECTEHPIGKTIIAMVIKEVLVPAIEEVGEETENALKARERE